ncbi:MAG: VOC family protein [Pseudomonadota bacterium]
MDPLDQSHTAPKFAAPDPGAAADWYEAALDFRKQVYLGGDYAIVQRGALTLHLWKCAERHIAENTSAYCELRDIEALNALHAEWYARFGQNGFAPGRIEAEPKDVPGHGMREFHIWDPSGNLIGFGAALPS